MKITPILTALLMFTPLFGSQTDSVPEDDYEEEELVKPARPEMSAEERTDLQAEQKALTDESCALFQQLIDTAAGITDRATADAAAPTILALNTRLQECLSRIIPDFVSHDDMLRLDEMMKKVAQASVRLNDARLFGSVALAKASGYSAAIVREHAELTLQAKEKIGAMLMKRYAELAAQYPAITGGPGWDTESAWVVANSETETQKALIDDIICGIGTEADIEGALSMWNKERSYAIVRISLLIDGQYYFLPMYVDITGSNSQD